MQRDTTIALFPRIQTGSRSSIMHFILTSLGKNAIITFGNVGIEMVWRRDETSGLYTQALLKSTYWKYFEANHRSFNREVDPIGCLTKVDTCSRPHRWWNTGTMTTFQQEKLLFQHRQQLQTRQRAKIWKATNQKKVHEADAAATMWVSSSNPKSNQIKFYLNHKITIYFGLWQTVQM